MTVSEPTRVLPKPRPASSSHVSHSSSVGGSCSGLAQKVQLYRRAVASSLVRLPISACLSAALSESSEFRSERLSSTVKVHRVPVVRLDPVSVDLATPALEHEHRQTVAELPAHEGPGLLALGDRRVHDDLAGVDDHVRDPVEGSTMDLLLQRVDEELGGVAVGSLELAVQLAPLLDGVSADLEAEGDLGGPEAAGDAVEDRLLVLRDQVDPLGRPRTEARPLLLLICHERNLLSCPLLLRNRRSDK